MELERKAVLNNSKAETDRPNDPKGISESVNNFKGTTEESKDSRSALLSTLGCRRTRSSKYSPHQTLLVYPIQGGPGAISVTSDDLLRLGADEFLNDTIVDLYLRYILDQIKEKDTKLYDEIHLFNSFFYKRLASAQKNLSPHEAVKKWTSKVDLFGKKFVIIPVNENFHWYVAVVCNLNMIPHQLSTISLGNMADESMSSMREESFQNSSNIQDLSSPSSSPIPTALSPNSQHNSTAMAIDDDQVLDITPKKTHRNSVPPDQPVIIIFDSLDQRHSRTFANIKDYIVAEALEKRSLRVKREMITGVYAKVPGQRNFSDCGIFLLHYIEQLLSDPAKYIPSLLNREDNTNIKKTNDFWKVSMVKTKREHMLSTIESLRTIYDTYLASRDPPRSDPAHQSTLAESDVELEIA